MGDSVTDDSGAVDAGGAVATSTSRTWGIVQRRGPVVLLALALALGAISAPLFGDWGRFAWCVALSGAALVLHLLWVERRWGRPMSGVGGALYFSVRTAIAFVLAWLNPFFAVFATVGYFDAGSYVPRRWIVPATIPVAITMAGSQSGGFPPQDTTQALAFAGLFVLNAGLVALFGAMTLQEEDEAARRDATIVELEHANTRLQDALDENARLQEELLVQARESGIHEERERLALEIHDTIAQGLTGIVTQLQAADDAPDARAARAHRRRAADLARSALGEARRSVQGLVPSSLEGAGLERALQIVVEDFVADQETRAELLVTGDPALLHQHVEAAVVRIAQEALTNVARHADAGRVGVTVSFLDGELLLDVRDDGSGFDPSNTRPNGTSGFGIPGMSTRAARVAGELVVESEPGQGTAVSLRVPVVSPGGGT
ncbi:sensor histidine kinase [Aeromicrobium sp. CF4.19]|uniref:sensor histidine kinase n=1 Tax=Aeromicrobium sp. CF4.19 TaxID=3373082 RepID=UPI003EE8112D